MNNKYEFEIEGIIYPRFIYSNKLNKYYDFKKVLLNSNYGRNYQLNNRSPQAYGFDLLVNLNYFNLPILREIPIIIENDSESSYYLLDYLIPSKSLVIELDSYYHELNKNKDIIRDEYLSKLGLEVYRIYNLTSDNVIKLKDYINSLPNKEFKLNYSNLINEYKEYKLKEDIEFQKLKYGELYFIQNKWRKSAEILSKYDPNFRDCILNNRKYELKFTLNEIYSLIPLKIKKTREYLPLINYYKKFNIDIIITRK